MSIYDNLVLANPTINFIEFLEETLIPDLKESGDINLANDFKKAIRYMKRKTKVPKKDKDEFLNYLKGLAADYRESGREFTAQDIETCYSFIYWKR